MLNVNYQGCRQWFLSLPDLSRKKTRKKISFSKRSLFSEIRSTCYWLHGFTALECCPAEAHGRHTADHPFSRKPRLMRQQRTEECIDNSIRKIWFQSSRTGIYFASPLLVDANTWEISVQFPSKCSDCINACLVSCFCYTHNQKPMTQSLFL